MAKSQEPDARALRILKRVTGIDGVIADIHGAPPGTVDLMLGNTPVEVTRLIDPDEAAYRAEKKEAISGLSGHWHVTFDRIPVMKDVKAALPGILNRLTSDRFGAGDTSALAAEDRARVETLGVLGARRIADTPDAISYVVVGWVAGPYSQLVAALDQAIGANRAKLERANGGELFVFANRGHPASYGVDDLPFHTQSQGPSLPPSVSRVWIAATAEGDRVNLWAFDADGWTHWGTVDGS